MVTQNTPCRRPLSLQETKKRSQPPTVAIATVMFFMGCAVGSLQNVASDTEILTSTRILTIPTAACKGGSSKSEKGWKSIQVFYGENKLPVPDKDWYSQVNQDQLVVGLLKGKKQGFFVDLAADDTKSNSLALERNYEWSGLCVDPDPENWLDLTNFRSCRVVGATVGSGGTAVDKTMTSRGAIRRGHGKLSLEQDLGIATTHHTTLHQVLRRAKTPSIIDYLSLDVGEAIENFPFYEYHIQILTVERPSEELKRSLKYNGFQMLAQISRFGETLWAHKDFVDNLDLSVLAPFQTKYIRPVVSA